MATSSTVSFLSWLALNLVGTIFPQRIPPPVSAEQMLQDLKNAPQDDVVFTSIPPGYTKPKGKGDNLNDL